MAKEKVLQDCTVEGCGKKGIRNMGVHMIKHNGPKKKDLSKEPSADTIGKDNPKPENENQSKTIDEKLDAVIAGLNSVSGAVMKLVDIQMDNNKKIAEPKKDSFNSELEDETYPKDYMPPKFRKIVDEVLSSEFGARVVDFEDRTDMQIDIIVPEKYSSLSAPDKEKGVIDIRSRIMPRALGENGVREWCMLVRKNLNRYFTREGVKSPFEMQA